MRHTLTLALTLLLACAARQPARGAQSTRSAQLAPPPVPTASAEATPILAPEAAPVAPPSVLYLIVPSASGLTCQAWEVEDNAEGVNLATLDRDDTTERRFALVQRLDREDRKPVKLWLNKSGAKLRVGSPEVRWGKLGVNSALGNCEQTLTISAADARGLSFASGAKLYFEQDECTRAVQQGEGANDFGACQPILRSYAQGVETSAIGPAKDPLRRIAHGGRRIFWYDERARVCRAWQFLPKASNGDQGTLRSPGLTSDRPRLQFEYQYELSDRSLTLVGPTTRTSSDTQQGGGSLCVERLYLGDRDASGVLVGGQRWFFDQPSCERDGAQAAEHGLRAARCGQ